MKEEENVIEIPEVPGQPLPRVTAIIDQLIIWQLMKWKIKQPLVYIKDYVLDLLQAGFLTLEEFRLMDSNQIIKDSEDYSKSISDKEASIGTRTHKAIQRFLLAKDEEEIEIDEDIQKPFHAFMRWWEENEVEPVSSELRVYSLDNRGFTGKLDMAAYIGLEPEKELYVIDFKTSPRIYDNMLLQLSAYYFAFVQCTGLELNKAGILRLDKVTGFPELHIFTTTVLEKYYRRFKCLVSYWHETNG